VLVPIGTNALDAVLPHDDVAVPNTKHVRLRYEAHVAREPTSALVVVLERSPSYSLRETLVEADGSLVPELDMPASTLGFPGALDRDQLEIPVCINPFGPGRGHYTPFPSYCPETWGWPRVTLVTPWSNVVEIHSHEQFFEGATQEMPLLASCPSPSPRPVDRDLRLYPPDAARLRGPAP
jgi:hypothetical protein